MRICEIGPDRSVRIEGCGKVDPHYERKLQETSEHGLHRGLDEGWLVVIRDVGNVHRPSDHGEVLEERGPINQVEKVREWNVGRKKAGGPDGE